MLEHRVDVCIEDWTDAGFRHVVDSAWDAVAGGPEDADSIDAAARLQYLLRTGGYHDAAVEIHQSVDEALAHVAHFDVSREPRGPGISFE